ncbi:hypothetical protein BGW80DRAFT_1115985, partial [Lactifluus volemus]
LLILVNSSKDLLQFAYEAWATKFLLTLYGYLGSLETPWEISVPGLNDVQTIQMLIDLVYPQSGYKAKDQINEKQTYFGRCAIKVVTNHFNSLEFIGNHAGIANFVLWATQSNGPMLFQSHFIISVFSPFIKYIKKSESDFGYPKGALGMAAASMSCAFLMYKTRMQNLKNIGYFSHEIVSGKVDDYI